MRLCEPWLNCANLLNLAPGLTTGTGKITRRKAFRAHLLEKKPTKRTRRLARTAEVTGGDKKRVERLLGRA